LRPLAAEGRPDPLRARCRPRRSRRRPQPSGTWRLSLPAPGVRRRRN